MPVLANARHEAFAQGLAKGLSASEAYEAAGYKPNRSCASRLLTNENIEARVSELVARGAERAEVDIARTLQELVRIGMSDIRRAFDANGNLLRVTDLDDDTAAAVASVEVVTRNAGRNEDGTADVEYVHKLRFWDKNSALDKIARHLGMMVERHEHSGPGGKPIQTEEMSARELLSDRIAGLAARRGSGGGSGGAD